MYLIYCGLGELSWSYFRWRYRGHAIEDVFDVKFTILWLMFLHPSSKSYMWTSFLDFSVNFVNGTYYENTKAASFLLKRNFTGPTFRKKNVFIIHFINLLINVQFLTCFYLFIGKHGKLTSIMESRNFSIFKFFV